MGILRVLRGFAQRLGPYLIIELLLPGGSLLALLLFLYRSRMSPSAQVAALAFHAKRALMQRWNAYRLGFEPR